MTDSRTCTDALLVLKVDAPCEEALDFLLADAAAASFA